ncbi:lipopolysaccharide biosynthesis protein [Sphingomonas sp. BN140010]|uniref:Lipopolysaccharide biosynthesis protein n=1 Tax=Sphingomonas arvum TaxID=2992113 RepID=A0ABT3JI76_9SPHN|nr:lipopolysaccharide biosynthesis protein [Sphingomonas sp. BN140010]MCW3798762.1 lipopolysaccharide biosynthesis protein [Sphingomonas sp. BN140010]
MPSYRNTAVRGAIVTGGGTVAKAVLQVLAIVVLARMLKPEDFGVMAMVFPIIAFASIFQQAGLGMAVLQRESVSNEELSTIFWTNVAIGVLVGALLVAVSPLVAAFYNEPRVRGLTAASGALMIVGALTSQHIILLMRKMEYGRLALVDLLSLAIGTALAILTAYLFHSYWAIFLLSFGTTASMCLLAWALGGWRPGRVAPLGRVKDVLFFGGNITASNLATYFGQNLDKILIGRWIGAVALGYYERAYKVVLLPTLFVHMPLFRLLVPMLSQSRSEPERHRRLFILGYQLSLFITVPGTLLLAFAAPQIVVFVLGSQWLSAAPIFSWLAIASLGQLVIGPLNMIFVSQGRSREAMLSSVVSSLYTSVAFVIGLKWGAVGVAAAFAISELVRSPAMLWYTTRTGPVSLREASLALAPFLLATGICGAGLVWLQSAFDTPGTLPFLVAAGTAAYAVTLLCMLVNESSRTFVREGISILRDFLSAGRLRIIGGQPT